MKKLVGVLRQVDEFFKACGKHGEYAGRVHTHPLVKDILTKATAWLERQGKCGEGWKTMNSCPKVHGRRFLAHNADIGEFTAEWFDGKGWVYSWNQTPCNPQLWFDIPKLPQPTTSQQEARRE